MENNQIRIDELKKQIDENNIDLKQIYQSVGERFVEHGEFSGNNTTVQEFLDNQKALENQLKELDIQLEDLRSSFRRISEISDRERIIGEEYSELEKENRNLFLPIGKAAFLQWKENPTEEFSKLMKNLEEIDNTIISFDNEIYKLANNEIKKKFLKKVKDKSRLILLQYKKKKSSVSINHFYKKTGEKIYKKDLSFFETMKNDSVSSFISNRKALEKLNGEILLLKEENSRLEKHLKNKYSSSRQKKAEEKLHSERELTLSEKMACLNDLGAYLYGEKIGEEDKEIKKYFKSADEICSKNSQLGGEIEKCKAVLEIANLEDEIDEMKKNITELQFSIEKSTSDITEFNKEIKRARAEIRKLKKTAEDSSQEIGN